MVETSQLGFALTSLRTQMYVRIFSVTGSAENKVCEPELENDFCDVTTFVFSVANHIA